MNLTTEPTHTETEHRSVFCPADRPDSPHGRHDWSREIVAETAGGQYMTTICVRCGLPWAVVGGGQS